MTWKRALVIMAGFVITMVYAYFAPNEAFQTVAKKEPVSSIGKSGALKSPGGTTEAEERRSAFDARLCLAGDAPPCRKAPS